MCPCKQVHRNIIKLRLGVEEVGQRQRLLVRGIVQTAMKKQMRKIRARCPVSPMLSDWGRGCGAGQTKLSTISSPPELKAHPSSAPLPSLTDRICVCVDKVVKRPTVGKCAVYHFLPACRHTWRSEGAPERVWEWLMGNICLQGQTLKIIRGEEKKGRWQSEYQGRKKYE